MHVSCLDIAFTQPIYAHMLVRDRQATVNVFRSWNVIALGNQYTMCAELY